MTALKSLAKTAVGSILEVVNPSLAREALSGQGASHSAKHKRWVLHARLERARWRKDDAAISAALASFWRGETADEFYEKYTDRFNDWFLGPHQVLIDALVDLHGKMKFTNLVEVGCGDGKVLEHCSKRMPDLARLTGLDINPTIIDRNRSAFASDPKLSFVADHAGAWLAANPAPDRILLTYGGVMEYFSQAELSKIFKYLRMNGPCAVALVEPVSPEHDLQSQTQSFAFGGENSFSHNHAHLLREAGFTIEFQQGMDLGLVRWNLILAASDKEISR